MELYLANGNEQYGPYSLEEIKSHYLRGNLHDSYWIWHQNLDQWIPLQDFVKRRRDFSDDPPTLPIPAPQTRPAAGLSQVQLKRITEKIGVARSVYLFLNGDRQGPFTFDEIQRQLETNQLPDDSGIWCKGMSEWVSLSECIDHIRGKATFSIARHRPPVATTNPTTAPTPKHPATSPTDIRRITSKFGSRKKATFTENS